MCTSSHEKLATETYDEGGGLSGDGIGRSMDPLYCSSTFINYILKF
jgi:hypothetical protein